MANPVVGKRPLLFTHHFFAGGVAVVAGDGKPDLTGFGGSVERVGAFFIHSLPTEGGEGFEDGGAGFVFLFILCMFDGGRAGESADRFDADDGSIAFDVDPVTPGFRFMPGFEFDLAKCGKNFAHCVGRFGFGESDNGFHGEGLGRLNGDDGANSDRGLGWNHGFCEARVF